MSDTKPTKEKRERKTYTPAEKLAYYDKLLERTQQLRDALALQIAISKDPDLKKRIEALAKK